MGRYTNILKNKAMRNLSSSKEVHKKVYLESEEKTKLILVGIRMTQKTSLTSIILI